MWQAMPFAASQWEPVQYGQDGAMPTGINDGCDPTTYTCFMAGEQEATIARVLNTDLPSLDVTKWQYYTCPAITDTYRCPGSASSSWTSTFANRTQVARMLIPTTSKYLPWNAVFGIAYIKEFKSYLMTGYQNRGPGTTAAAFAWAPAIQGPWITTLSVPTDDAALPTTRLWPGFMSPSLALGYTVVSTNPPHVKLTTVQDSPYYSSQTTPFFGQWDLVLGRTPMWQGGDNPHYSSVFGYATNAGYVLSESHAPGTIPRKNLLWAFDFYDHGGDTTAAGMIGFHDIANGTAFLMPCSGLTCNEFNAGQGNVLGSYGAQIVDGGYGRQMLTTQHETPATMASGLTLLNAPAAVQGNGTFTVGGVFRFDGTTYNNAPLWMFGDASGSNTEVALSYSNYTGGPLELGWGVNANRWRYTSGFTMVAGNWYFIACTVQANGATPIGHMWMGVGGALVDQIAGVPRTSTGGTPTQTPNVSASPLILGMEPGQTHSVNASYASLFLYGRALGQAEAGLMYRTVKTKMAARGVAVQ
jgi:hypothetical protein